MLTPTAEIVDAAWRAGTGVAAFNVITLDPRAYLTPARAAIAGAVADCQRAVSGLRPAA